MAAVDDKVKQIIVEELGVDEAEVTSNASFVDDLGADSLDTVELVLCDLVHWRELSSSCRGVWRTDSGTTPGAAARCTFNSFGRGHPAYSRARSSPTKTNGL